VLSREQRRLAELCSSSKDRSQRFDGSHFRDHDIAPYVDGAQACVFCSQDGRYLYGTHSLVIGKVRELIVRDAAGLDSLVYHAGAYGTVALA
jgi:flavin reductase (DIM6/NTAB) family NADH-FMN oxidoreductase RutF